MRSTPFFLRGPSGPLFCLELAADSAAGPAVLHCPALGEEMNKSRKMVAWQARELAGRGVSVLLVDLHGTGDSAGGFGEASWGRWLEDLVCARAWLADRGHAPIWLWGHRAGCLLAAELAEGQGLLLWQPVVRGATWLTQLLRLRTAASMMSDEGREDARALRQRLLDGEGLEVAGYEVSPGLARGLESATLAGALAGRAAEVAWIEVSANEPPRVAPAATRLIDEAAARGARIGTRAVAGEAFWATQEIAVAPAMIPATLEALAAFAGWPDR